MAACAVWALVAAAGAGFAPASAGGGAAAEAPARGRALLEHPELRAALEVFDAWVAQTVRERGTPSVAIGIVHDQDLLWGRGYGLADLARRTPATPRTVYRIASITKPITATAILQLRDAGRLRLDDPLVQHVPWFRLEGVGPDDPPITIRHLLTHTSGMPRELELLYWDDLRFPPDTAMPRLVRQARAVFPPEHKYKYSNLAVALAGDVVAAVSGESYGDYVRRHVFEPLGMKDSWVVPARDRGALATGYSSPGPGRVRRPMPFLDLQGRAAAGNGASSVEDLARFLSLQFRDGPAGGAQVLRGSTLREMQRVHWLQPDWQAGRGLGWSVTRVGDQTRIGHTGSVPGFRGAVSAVTEDRIAVIVLTNAEDGRPGDYMTRAWSMVAPALKKAAAAREKEPRPAAPGWSAYLGPYERPAGDRLRVVLVGEELALVVMTNEDPWNSRITLAPVSPGVFRMEGGFQEGELVRFATDAAGRVTHLVMPGYSYRKSRERR